MSKIIIETGRENTILRNISTPLQKSELHQYNQLIQDMLKHIRNPENGGVGLAAPQVGVNKRIIVVSLMRTYEDETFKTIAMINPEIMEHSDAKCFDTE
jgi:peptide deformylase